MTLRTQLDTSEVTLVRIRGKRNAKPAQKWHYGKERKHLEKMASSHTSADETSQAAGSRSSKRRRLGLSRLELLPAELIQEILIYSGNLDLPLASPRLAGKLSGRQLQWQLAQNALSPIIRCAEGTAATTSELRSAARLLNSRFVTWAFFRHWLEHEASAHKTVQTDGKSGSDSCYADLWIGLQLSPGVLPPAKLLRGPWTSDHLSFLQVFASQAEGCTASLDGRLGEVAYRGLLNATQEGCIDALQLLRNLHVMPDQELLRKAVIDYGCKREIVMYILHWCASEVVRSTSGGGGNNECRPNVDIDFLDPSLWAWAERAQNMGSTKGEWLTKTLRRVSSVTANSDDTLKCLPERNGGGARVHNCK